MGYSWNGGNTTNPPTLGKGDKHTTLPSTNVPIDRTVSPNTESDWLTKLSNATSVIVDIGVEIIDLSPLGDLSRIIIGTDVRGNPVSLAERLMTAGCLLIPGSKYAVKAVDAATTIVKKGGKIADTIVKKGSTTVKKLANELDKHLPITPNAPSPIPALEGIPNVPQWLDDQFTKGVAKVETPPSIGKSNRAKTTTTQSNKTTSKTTTPPNKQTPPNPDPKKTEKPSSKPEHTKEKLPSEAEIKSELDELSKAMNDAGGEINPAMNDRVNILLDQLNRHQQLASKQAADLQEKLRNLLKLRGLQANTLARIKNLLNQLQGNSEATTTTEPTTTAPQTATPLEANFKDLTIDERIKQLQQRKKDGAITSLEEQELGNLEFAKQQNNVEELRKRIEEIEKDNSMESVDKERLLKLLRKQLKNLRRSLLIGDASLLGADPKKEGDEVYIPLHDKQGNLVAHLVRTVETHEVRSRKEDYDEFSDDKRTHLVYRFITYDKNTSLQANDYLELNSFVTVDFYEKKPAMSADFQIPREIGDTYGGIGEAMFKDGLEYIKRTKNTDAPVIKAQWVEDSPEDAASESALYKDFGGRSINLQRYLDAKANGMTDEKAAFATITGMWAKNEGYDKAVPDDKQYAKKGVIKAIFYKTKK